MSRTVEGVNLITASDPDSDLCASGGLTHDYRPLTYRQFNAEWTSWVCVWCHVVACGNYGNPDPCWLPYHHEPEPHLSRAGVRWPIGGTR